MAVAELATVALLLSSVPAMGEGRFDCSTLVPINVSFEPSDANTACGSLTPPQCLNVTNGILSAKSEIDKAHEALCGMVNQVDSEAANAALSVQQKTAYEQQIKIYNGAATAYGDYQKVLMKASQDVGNLVMSSQGPLNPVDQEHNQQEKSAIARALSDKSASLSSLNGLPDHPMKSITNPPTEDGTIYAARNGVSFLKALVRQVNDTKGKIASLNSNQSRLTAAEDLSNGEKEKKEPSTVTGDKKDDGSGLDLKSLAGLASAGAGLAGLMNKGSGSSAGDTSTNTSSQTSGEPGGQQQQQASKLGDSKADSTNAPVGVNMKQPAPVAPSARSPASPSPEPFDSNISRNTPSTGASAATPATAKATGGGSMGGAKAADKPEDPAAKQSLAAAGPPPDDSLSMGGGGGPPGGGGAPSLASNPGDKPPGSDAAAAPEAAMNDLLHEMKETVDSANGGAQGSPDIVMGEEDLFPRVRSCYTRLMKSGRVLDGLNEKISPESP